MTLVRWFPILSYAFALVSILAACLAQDALLMLLFAGGAAVASRLITEGPGGRHLARRGSLVLTIVLILVVGYQVAANPSPEEAMVGLTVFSVWLLVIKLCERRTLEIEAERLMLASVLMVLATMDAFDLIFGMLYMVWILLGISTILLFGLYYGAEVARRDSGDTLDRGTNDPTIGQHVRRHLRNAVLLIVAAVSVTTAVVFLAFPRGVSQELATAAAARIARTGGGQDSEVTLLSGTRFVETTSRVGVVSVDMQSQDQAPPHRLYLRTGTSSVYLGGGRWRPTPFVLPVDEDVAGGAWTTLGFSDGTPIRQLRIELDQSLNFLPVPGGSTDIRSSDPMPLSVFRRRAIVALRAAAAGVIQIRDAGGPPMASGLWNAGGAVPARVESVAWRVVRDRGLPEEPPEGEEAAVAWRVAVSSALEAYLQSPRFRYTLDLSRIGRSADVRGMDPLERFLLAEPVGHCEYFAAAFVAMAQATGLEARIVTGFMVEPEEPGGTSFVILDRDAHAWAEVRVSEHRWERYDPTVARRVELAETDEGFTASIKAWYYEVEAWWRLNILGFDAPRQEEVADVVLPPAGQFVEWVRSTVETTLRGLDVAFGRGRFGSVWSISVAIVVLLTIVLLVRAWLRKRAFLRRIGVRKRREAARAAPAVAAYRDLLKLLSGAGLVKPEWRTPLLWCGDIRQARPDLAAPATRVVRAFYDIRYGGAPPDAAAIRKDLSEIRSRVENGP
ncbi:MAG: transglutaminase domain-containing protein [Phycisphaerales bacterium]|jgi:transglutaminase-like putative cysteine protease|nr:transglutaminase domain-containing protein [Phycisphaerales bacterium]